MSDLREIFLQPECCADEAVGRLWCEHDSPVDCEDGVPWTRYVRADEVAALRVAAQMAVQAHEDGEDMQGAIDRLAQLLDAALAERERT